MVIVADCAAPTALTLGAAGTVVAGTALLADEAADVPSGPVAVTA